MAVGVRIAAVVPDMQPVVLECSVYKVYSPVSVNANVTLVAGIFRAEISHTPVIWWPPGLAIVLRDEEPGSVVVPRSLRTAWPGKVADKWSSSRKATLSTSRPTIGAGPAQVLVCSIVHVTFSVDRKARLVADGIFRIELAVVLVNALRCAWQPDGISPCDIFATASRPAMRFRLVALVRRDP